MAWNVLTIAGFDQDNGPLYPTATKRGLGVVLGGGESVLEKHDFGLISVYRRRGDEWAQLLKSQGNKGRLLITTERVIVVFEGVPKNRSMFVPLPLAQEIAGAGRHRGERLVGHIRYPWVAAIAARPRSFATFGMLRISAVDATSEPPQGVMIEINKDKAPQIAAQIALPLYRQRSERPELSVDDEALAKWRDAARAGFQGAPRLFTARSFTPCVHVR